MVSIFNILVLVSFPYFNQNDETVELTVGLSILESFILVMFYIFKKYENIIMSKLKAILVTVYI